MEKSLRSTLYLLLWKTRKGLCVYDTTTKASTEVFVFKTFVCCVHSGLFYIHNSLYKLFLGFHMPLSFIFVLEGRIYHSDSQVNRLLVQWLQKLLKVQLENKLTVNISMSGRNQIVGYILFMTLKQLPCNIDSNIYCMKVLLPEKRVCLTNCPENNYIWNIWI